MSKEAKATYRVNSLNVQELNQALQLIADRFDNLEGTRGTPAFESDVDLKENNILNVGIDDLTRIQHNHGDTQNGGPIDLSFLTEYLKTINYQNTSEINSIIGNVRLECGLIICDASTDTTVTFAQPFTTLLGVVGSDNNTLGLNRRSVQFGGKTVSSFKVNDLDSAGNRLAGTVFWVALGLD